MFLKQIHDYNEINYGISNYLHPGVFTNNFLSKKDYEREIAAETLFYHATPDVLLLFRERHNRFILTYYLNNGGELPPIDVEKTIVTEIPLRPKDAARSETLLKPLKTAGFQHILLRQRLTRTAITVNEQNNILWPSTDVTHATMENFHQIEVLLRESFDPLTGCIDSPKTLAEEIKAGEILCRIDHARNIGAVLHFSENNNFSEIHHLACRKDLQGKQFTQPLFNQYLKQTMGKKLRVWTGEKNATALRFYERNGYTPDGWLSVVWYK